MTDERDIQPPLPAPFPPAPDLLAPVHAFRDWRVSPDALTSPRTGVAWPERVLVAECRPTRAEDLVRLPHSAPGHDCTCGIHAYVRPGYETSKVHYSGVTGIISVWGNVELHADGLRAEYARIEALGIYARWTRRQKSAVDGVATELGVDVVDLYELEAAAPRYAPPVPAGLVPARPRKPRARPATVAPRRLVIPGQ